MDHCAYVLLAFPGDIEPTDNELYHKAVRQHVQKVERLMKENAANFSNLAGQLLEVSPILASLLPIFTLG